MKAAVLSDTHDLLREEALSRIRECDAVIHAGDFCARTIMEQIIENKKADAPFYAVRGNNDGMWANELPKYLQFSLGGVRIFAVHDRKDIPVSLGSSQIVIYGHSHKYSAEEKEGRLWLNPGSCGKQRFSLPLPLAVLHMEDGRCWADRIEIQPVKAASANSIVDRSGKRRG